MASFLRKLCDLHCRSGNVASISLRSCQVAIQGVQLEDGSSKLSLPTPQIETRYSKEKHKYKETQCCKASCIQDVKKDIDFIRKLVSSASFPRQNPNLHKALEYRGLKKSESSKSIFEENIYIWCSGIIALSGLLFSHGWQRQQKDRALHAVSIPPSLHQMLKDYFWGLSSDHLILKVNAKPIQEVKSESKGQIKSQASAQAEETDETSHQDLLAEALSKFSRLKAESVTEVLNTLAIHLTQNSQDAKAFNLFKQAASHGDPTALFNVGLCYENGRGVAQSIHQAMKYYRSAADRGHSKAMYNLANIYINKVNLSANEQEERLVFMERAAEQRITQAQKFLGVYYAKAENWSKALRYFRLAGESEDPVSLYNAGLCFERGLGTEKDLNQAMCYYLRGAKKGHRNSQFNVGVAYEKGLGGMKCDALQAIFWYTKASNQGDSEAQLRLDNIQAKLSLPQSKGPIRKSTLQVPLLPQWSIFGKDFPKSFSSPNLLSGFTRKSGLIEEAVENNSDVKEHSLIMVSQTVL